MYWNLPKTTDLNVDLNQAIFHIIENKLKHLKTEDVLFELILN